jgi:hypothetical protein
MSEAHSGQDWTDELRDAVETGQLIDLAPGKADGEINPSNSLRWSSERLLPAQIIRKLLVKTALVTDPQGLRIRGARITGQLVLDYATLPCRLEFIRCSFDQPLTLAYAKLPNLKLDGSLLPGLSLKSAQIAGSCELIGINATGTVDLEGIRISGLLDLTKAAIAKPYGYALSLDSAEVAGDVFMDKMAAKGEVRALGARFGGAFFLGEARLENMTSDSNPNGHALFLDNAEIRGNAFFSKLVAKGEVRALGAQFGSLILQNAVLANETKDALTLDRSQITINASLSAAQIRGNMRAVGTTFGGQLDLTDLNIGDQMQRGGAAIFLSSSIGTLNVSGLRVQGGLNLSSATIGVLSVGKTEPHHGLPVLSGVRNWSLGTIDGFIRTDSDKAARWLDSLEGINEKTRSRLFSVQPWKEVARAYDQLGQQRDSRFIRYWAEVRATRTSPLGRRFFRWLYGLFVGYGYRPFRVLGWILFLYIVALIPGLLSECSFAPTTPNVASVCITSINGEMERVQTSSITSYPSYNAWLFALDAIVPGAPGGQSPSWRAIEDPLPALFSLIKGFSWVLAALLLAAITGILKKD